MSGELASRHPHGTVTRAQLRRTGLTDDQIDHRISTGRLRVVHRGVYLVAGHPPTDPGRWLAAVLACGPRAVLSHRDAAALWSLLPSPSGDVHVTVPAGTGHLARPGISLHRGRLTKGDTRTHDAIPVTAPARTLIDIAPLLSPRALERALDEAFFLRHVNLRTITAALARNTNRPGSAALRRCVERHEPGTTRTESELEEAMFELCRRHRLPLPLCQVEVEGHRVDFYWPDHRVIAEADGWQSHRSRVSFEADRERDARLRLAGYRPPLRFTHRQVTRQPGLVVESLQAELKR
jgi:very-short-patch-repair endonuclease